MNLLNLDKLIAIQALAVNVSLKLSTHSLCDRKMKDLKTT
jgi:hypothetical protein